MLELKVKALRVESTMALKFESFARGLSSIFREDYEAQLGKRIKN